MEREGKKVLASYETGCNVNLKHTRIKTGAGGGWGNHPEGPSGFFLSSAFGKSVCADFPLLASLSHPSRTS